MRCRYSDGKLFIQQNKGVEMTFEMIFIVSFGVLSSIYFYLKSTISYWWVLVYLFFITPVITVVVLNFFEGIQSAGGGASFYGFIGIFVIPLTVITNSVFIAIGRFIKTYKRKSKGSDSIDFHY